MGSRGPAPKRIAERLGHITKAQKADVSTVRREGVVRVPAADRTWHPIALRWYRSLKDSGESDYYEPSDWAAAQYVATAMSKNLTDGKFSAMLFSQVWSAMESLLTTEASRRRVRLEVERDMGEHEQEGPTAIEKYRARLEG